MFFCKNNSALSLTLRAHIVVGSLAVVQRLIHDDVPTCHLRDGSHFVRHEDNGAVAGIIGDNIIEMRLKTLVDVAQRLIENHHLGIGNQCTPEQRAL